MFGQFFNIDESVFSIAPNPKYLYLSRQHEEALAHLVYGVTRKGGFVCLTGDIGTGKTTICRTMFEQLPENTDIAFVINPKFSPLELLASICDELKISYSYFQPNVKEYVKKIHEYLIDAHAKGRNTVLVIDEAQNLSADTLEHVRALTNVETNEEKLLQIILIGQPELKDLLAKPELEQVNQRITARFHIGPLNLNETNHYISHRLSIAGATQTIFTKSNIKQIHRLSCGVPRLINILCDRILLGAYTLSQLNITSAIIKQSADEVFESKQTNRDRYPRALVASLFALLISGAVVFAYQNSKPNLIENKITINATDADIHTEDKIHENNHDLTYENDDRYIVNEDNASEDKVINARVDRENSGHSINEVKPESYNDDSDIAIYDEHETNSIENDFSKRGLAFQEIFRLWGIEYSNSSQEPCEQAIAHNLYCFKSNGDIATLRKLNRPSVLKSSSTHFEPSYAALVSIEDDKAILSEKGNLYLTEISEIEANWSGEYEVLWRPIAPGKKYIIPGAKGKAVQELDIQLAKVMGHDPLLSNPFIYSSQLEIQVKNFQISRKITADAIVGPITQIQIKNALGTDTPYLFKN